MFQNVRMFGDFLSLKSLRPEENGRMVFRKKHGGIVALALPII